MRVYHFSEKNPIPTYLMLVSDLMDTKPFQTGEWQAMDVSGSALHETHELEDVTLVWDQIPSHALDTIPGIDFNWAREHFGERVSGQPLNPAPSHLNWPYAVRGNGDHTRCPKCGAPTPNLHPAVSGGGEVTSLCSDPFHKVPGGYGQFDHTYPERFWPQHAGHDHNFTDQDGKVHHVTNPKDLDILCGGQSGIRFPYGDLRDVVGLLATKPLTRQAYLPVWFPEDTGATEGQRVPCTLGYHFMQRNNRLSCRYYMRSCEVYRHLSNDVFFAAALMHWICQEVAKITNAGVTFRPGSLVMHISSLHAFVGDKQKIRDRFKAVSEQ